MTSFLQVRVMPSGPRLGTLPAAAVPSRGRPASWIHRQWNEQAFVRHSKGRFPQPFHSNEAVRRVRAIAADRTLASLTGSCSKPVNFRIYTEFCDATGGPGRLDSRAGQRPLPDASAIRNGSGRGAMARWVAARRRSRGGKQASLPTLQTRHRTRATGRAVRSRPKTPRSASVSFFGIH
jgi:hypothetical protein